MYLFLASFCLLTFNAVLFCEAKAQNFHLEEHILSCKKALGKEGTVCKLLIDKEPQEEIVPECFDEKNEKDGSNRVYCPVQCDNPDHGTILKTIPSNSRSCNKFYTYQLERRPDNKWYIWRSGDCLNIELSLTVHCRIPQP